MPTKSLRIIVAARKLLNSYGRGRIPTPLDSICEALRIRVQNTPDEKPSFERGSWNTPTGIQMGFIANIPDNADRLIRRHMLAHLIGHIYLGQGSCDYQEKTQGELQAIAFATELLMPSQDMRHYISIRPPFEKEEAAVIELAEIFDVHPRAMRARYREIRKGMQLQ